MFLVRKIITLLVRIPSNVLKYRLNKHPQNTNFSQVRSHPWWPRIPSETPRNSNKHESDPLDLGDKRNAADFSTPVEPVPVLATRYYRDRCRWAAITKAHRSSLPSLIRGQEAKGGSIKRQRARFGDNQDEWRIAWRPFLFLDHGQVFPSVVRSSGFVSARTSRALSGLL